MAKRVHEIAKELGIDSKAIVKKCQAEGIPEAVIKNHMSTVSAGLEVSIREWFTAGDNSTAIETSEKVELEAVRIKPKAKARARSVSSETEPESGGSSTVVIEAPPSRSEAPTEAVPVAAVSAPAPARV